MSGPLARVRQAIESGAKSRKEICEISGLQPSMVDVAIEHLQRMGMLVQESLGSSCAGGGCSSCPSGTSDGTPGCGGPGTTSRGPVALVLTASPRRNP